MTVAIELTPRQATRVVEQALRAKTRVELELRSLPDGMSLEGALVGREGNLLVVELEPPASLVTAGLVMGAFCEVRIWLSGELYQFSTCVLDVTELPHRPRVFLAVPDTVQVVNRRQFERTIAMAASQVRLWLAGHEAPAVGLLANVSPEGLACNLPDAGLDQTLSLEDRLRISFELAGVDETFELPVILCNKTYLSQEQQFQLGMRFAVDPDDLVAEHALRRVRGILLERTSNPSEEEGAA